MELSISKTSWHALFYKWFYNGYRMPQSLCPYFWKLLLAILVMPVIGPFSLPIYFIFKFFKKSDLARTMKGMKRSGEALVGGFIYMLIMCVVGFIITIEEFLSNSKIGSWESAGFFMVGLIGFILLCYWINNLMEAIKEKRRTALYNKWREEHSDLYYHDYREWVEEQYREKRRPKNWLIVLAIKAWYEKNCPMINWKP